MIDTDHTDAAVPPLLVRRLIDESWEAMWILDAEGRFVYANQACARLLGVPVGELLGSHALDFAPPGDPEPRAYYASLGRGPRLTGRTGVLRRDGTLRTCEFRVRSDLHPGHHVGFARDVTDEAAMQRQLARLEEHLSRLLATAPLILSVMDGEGRITLSLGKGLQRLGFFPGELVGRHATELFGDLPGVPALLERVARGEAATWTGTLGAASIEAHLFPVLDPAGTVDRVIGITLDVSDRQEAEERARRAQKMEALARLAGGVAHDFNNVLSVILTYGHTLLDDLGPDDPRRDDVLQMVRAGERAGELTRQLLALGRRQPMTPRPVHLAAAVSDLERMLGRVLGEDVSLRRVDRARGAAVRADPAHLEQVLLNLVLNARDAMPQGGTLTITTDRVTLGPADAAALETPPGDYATLAVADTGVGMDAATRERIFEPFFTTKEAGRGTGLGLAVVFGIVRQSGGRILVTSAPGDGTTFTLFFPTVDDAAAAPEPPPPTLAPPSSPGHETLLLVEDDAAVRAAAETALTRRGYHVIAAENGGEALLLAEQHDGPIDLLLTDVLLPRISGAALAARLERDRPELRTLFVTGHGADAVPAEAHRERRLLAKPFTPETLARKVREVLDLEGAAVSARGEP